MTGRAEIEDLQLQRLRAMIAEVRPANRFYQRRLKEAGVDEKIASLAAFSKKMPFTTKMDLVWDREEFPPYGSNLTYPIERYSRLCQSSGTTSGPLPTLDTPESWGAMLDCWDVVYEAAGVSPKEVIFFAFSFGPFLGFWTAFDAATRRGNLSIPGGGLSSLARLQAMSLHQATVLCCTPTYAIRLGQVLAEQDPADLPGLCVKKIIVAGEPGGSMPELRRQIESYWKGARVFDHHGMTELGPVSFEHPEHPMNLCVIEGSYYVEVIDRETHQEVAEGERGELVVTNLTRLACPLMRYRTGDLVQKGYLEDSRTDPPRRLLTLEGGILGRVDDMVVIRGVNLYPTAVEKVIRGFPEVAEFQVIQSTRQAMAELEVVVEPMEDVSTENHLAQRIGTALSNAFTLRIPVRLVEPNSLPRFEFKSKRWIKNG